VEHKKILFSGNGNHQYGLKGSKNSSWKSDERISSYGYKLIRVLNHPFRNSDDMVFEHRLLAEKYLLTEENSVFVNGIAYLSKEYDVHHKDFNRANNSLDNLVVMKKSAHKRLHNLLAKTIHDSAGHFIGKVKATEYMTTEEIIKFTDDFLKRESA